MPLSSDQGRILARRADDVQVLRRGRRAVALSDAAGGIELSAVEQRLLVEMERPRIVDLAPTATHTPVLKRLYEARLVALNGRLRPFCPPPDREGVPPPTIDAEQLTESSGTVFVRQSANDDLAPLVAASTRGVTAIPRIVVTDADGFFPAFDRLAKAGFRVMRVEPAPVETDEAALRLAHGYVDMIVRAADPSLHPKASFRLSGVDDWLARAGGTERPFSPPHPRCTRCPMHAICRPDLTRVAAGSPSCAFSRFVAEAVVWMLADRPDLPRRLGGR